MLASLADVPVVVVSPGLLTSVVIERGPAGGDEVHVHAAGQGYWVARMAAALGARPVLVTTCGGEAAAATIALVDQEIELRLVPTDGPSGLYIDDRRAGDRERIATNPAAPIGRHAADDLVAIAVAAGAMAGVVALTGSNGHDVVDPAMFATVSAALAALDVTVVVDLSGPELAAALDGHVDVVKIADDELDALVGRATGGASGSAGECERRCQVRADAERLRSRTGAEVFVTLADAGAFAATDGGALWGSGPRLRTVDHRGAGDSFTAALAVGHRAGLEPVDRFRLALAASATNVLRHGLGSTTLDAVDALLTRVTVRQQEP